MDAFNLPGNAFLRLNLAAKRAITKCQASELCKNVIWQRKCKQKKLTELSTIKRSLVMSKSKN
jgi:hypothetical protein